MANKGTTQSSMHSMSTRLAHLLAQSSWIPCTPNFLEFLFSSCLCVIGSTMNLCSDNGRQLNAFTKRNFKTLSAPWLDTVQTVTRDAGSLCYSLGQTTLEAGIVPFLWNLVLFSPAGRLVQRTGISSEMHVIRTIYIITRSFLIHLTMLHVYYIDVGPGGLTLMLPTLLSLIQSKKVSGIDSMKTVMRRQTCMIILWRVLKWMRSGKLRHGSQMIQ